MRDKKLRVLVALVFACFNLIFNSNNQARAEDIATECQKPSALFAHYSEISPSTVTVDLDSPYPASFSIRYYAHACNKPNGGAGVSITNASVFDDGHISRYISGQIGDYGSGKIGIIDSLDSGQTRLAVTLDYTIRKEAFISEDAPRVIRLYPVSCVKTEADQYQINTWKYNYSTARVKAFLRGVPDEHGLIGCEKTKRSFDINIRVIRKWQSNAQTQLSNGVKNNRSNPLTVARGSSTEFNHSIRSDRIHNVGTLVNYSIIETREGGGRPREERVVSRGRASQRLGEFMRSNSSFRDSTTSSDNVGRTICHYLRYSPAHFNLSVMRTQTQFPSGGGAETHPACIYIPYNYELTPCVNAHSNPCGGNIPQEPGSLTPVNPRIVNPNGGTPSRPDTQWIITTWRVDGSNEKIPVPNSNTDNNSSDTCAVYNARFQGKIQNCNNQERGTGTFPSNTTTDVGGEKRLVIPEDAPLGTRYCIAVSVSPYNLRNNETQAVQNNKVGREWRHSIPLCVMATKKPKLQVWGDGIYSRSGIRTSRSNYTGKGIFGSWVEYETIAGAGVRNFASESSRTGTNLTFANSHPSHRGSWGMWPGTTDASRQIRAILDSRYSESREGVFVENATERYGGYKGSDHTNTHTHIVRSSGNLFLTGNITAREPEPGVGVNTFQQNIIIVDGDLTISREVTQIDAWLIVSGTITTCVDEKGDGRANASFVNEEKCNKPLRINGPILAGNLNPWRTGNSDYHNPETPSEIYNQRPDVYLWAISQGSAHTKAITTYTKELPARY